MKPLTIALVAIILCCVVILSSSKPTAEVIVATNFSPYKCFRKVPNGEPGAYFEVHCDKIPIGELRDAQWGKFKISEKPTP